MRRCGHASPAARCGRLCCCNTATTRKSSRGTCGSGCCSTRTGRRTTRRPSRHSDQANKTAREQFTGYLAAKLREIRLVEYTFSNNPVTRDGHGPRASNLVGERLSDIQEWEHGETTPVLARLGPAGLETVDTLIMAGIAATRAEAIRWALDRIRERPAYQRLRELRCDADKLRNEF